MSSTSTFACPSCGAPLEPQGDQIEIKCPFCGNVVVVPESLRQHPTPTQAPPAYQSYQPQIVIIEPGQQPQFGFEPPAQLQNFRARRNRGCGCSGCFGCLGTLGALLGLLIGIGAVVYSTQPGVFADL